MSVSLWRLRAASPRTAARSRSSAGSRNRSAGFLLSQMMCLPSTSRPTTVSSRMPTSSGPPRRARQLRTLDQRRVNPALTRWQMLSAQAAQVTQGAGMLATLDPPVAAFGERADVVGFDGREHRHPQLVAAEFAVRLGVDDAVCPQHLGDRAGVHLV